ncbi:GIDE domain-containing protein [Saccharomonospora sp. CUA-673]|uniref:GIDE domain-containing protein n=1 Tax=Saccharomonospora sp. CUA-673 TaxID=1904969 RepID=UPI0035167713
MAGVVAFFFMRHTKKSLHAMIGTETYTIPELEERRKISDDLGARGSFRKSAEVVGAAYPPPSGILTSELSKSECVWYRYTVEREYEHTEYRDGKRQTRRRTEKLTDHTSHGGFAVIDEAGRTIGVDLGGERPDKPEQVIDRFEPHQAAAAAWNCSACGCPISVAGTGRSATSTRNGSSAPGNGCTCTAR